MLRDVCKRLQNEPSAWLFAKATESWRTPHLAWPSSHCCGLLGNVGTASCTASQSRQNTVPHSSEHSLTLDPPSKRIGSFNWDWSHCWPRQNWQRYLVHRRTSAEPGFQSCRHQKWVAHSIPLCSGRRLAQDTSQWVRATLDKKTHLSKI